MFCIAQDTSTMSGWVLVGGCSTCGCVGGGADSMGG